MNKFIKTLIILNGLLIPLIVLIIAITFLWDQFKFRGNSYDNSRVITKNLKIEELDTLLLQGLDYSNPLAIDNSTNYYIEFRTKEYKEPQSKKMFSEPVNFEGGGSRYSDSDLLNILFLDHEFKPINTLVNRKAFIAENTLEENHWNNELDTLIRHILYLISFKDSNKDGYIDSNDESDLYLTDLNGNGLTKITDGIEINSFKIINRGKGVFLSYYKKSDVREEYKILRFAIYNIEKQKLQYLDKIDLAIKEVNKLLIE